jgi:spore cortex formation protein SpoVR/YcgB (stage V sporulation)
VLKHVHRLWSFPVKLECVEGDATVAELRCPPPATKAGVAA